MAYGITFHQRGYYGMNILLGNWKLYTFHCYSTNFIANFFFRINSPQLSSLRLHQQSGLRVPRQIGKKHQGKESAPLPPSKSALTENEQNCEGNTTLKSGIGTFVGKPQKHSLDGNEREGDLGIGHHWLNRMKKK